MRNTVGMGAAQSQMDPKYVGIYKKLLSIQNQQTRLQTIDTLLGDPTAVHHAKLGGVYGALLQYAAAVRHGGAAPLLPGEVRPSGSMVTASAIAPIQQRPPASVLSSGYGGGSQVLTTGQPQHQDPFKHLAKPKSSEKALSFFSACLRVLNIQEEIALTEESLKSAYKKAVIRAHPDKGGSKEAFDAVTRAYAYLMDILKLVKGQQGRTKEAVQTLDGAREARANASEDWKMPVKPVKLNPNNLNMTVFNEMFEQTRIPDPDEDGYGDWLKGGDDASKAAKRKGMKKFSEEFNRDVFNQMFEDEAKTSRETTLANYSHPQEMILNVNMGVELGRDRPADYTAAPNSKQQFTDLRAAYTVENTVSNKIAGVRVENRDFNSYKAQRERAPDAYSQSEMAQLQAYEEQKKRAEEARRMRAAQEQIGARDYFERMKQLVITDK